MLAYDIKINETDGDLYIDPKTGDFVISASDNQHINDIIASYPGYWKQFPLVGVAVANYLNSSGQNQQLKNQIVTQLQADGYSVGNIKFTTDAEGNLTIIPQSVARN